jgi:hypothetical protein
MVLWYKARGRPTNGDSEIILRLLYLMQETITAGYTLTLPFHLPREVRNQP